MTQCVLTLDGQSGAQLIWHGSAVNAKQSRRRTFECLLSGARRAGMLATGWMIGSG